jgi:hypothetical protein
MARRAFMVLIPCLLAGTITGLAGCPNSLTSPDAAAPVQANGPPWFEDITDAAGLQFVHDAGPAGTYFMPQIMGSGCAFIHDGDGSLYIYLLHLGGKRNQLFKQQPDGTFKDVSAGSGLDIAGRNTGVAVGDVNNDGLPDVLVTQYGGIKLFLNLGEGHFEDVTREAGLSNPLWGMSAAFFDYDRDGLLDLVVANYLDYREEECLSPAGRQDYCHPKAFAGRSARLFHNTGPRAATADRAAARVTFEDVSFTSGLGKLVGPGLGVVCADFDGDGWPDIFIANDGKPNYLWMNQRDGTFREEAVSRGAAYTSTGNAYAGMGIAIGDISGSGMFDLFVTHLDTETHTLWKQGPRGQFRDVTVVSGTSATRWRGTGWGTLLVDFDLDGSLDLAVVNGRVRRGGDAAGTSLNFWETYAEHNQLLAGDGTGKFRDISLNNQVFCDTWNIGRSLACADINSDGAPDLLVCSVAGRARLFRNVAPGRGHWIKVRAWDPQWRRDAYGAEVRVRAGGKEWLRLVNPAQGYLSSSSPLVFFGLGKVDRISEIEVTWPDPQGPVREIFPGGPADQTRELHRGKGQSS